jgi:hypothetical protein
MTIVPMIGAQMSKSTTPDNFKIGAEIEVAHGHGFDELAVDTETHDRLVRASREGGAAAVVNVGREIVYACAAMLIGVLGADEAAAFFTDVAYRCRQKGN